MPLRVLNTRLVLVTKVMIRLQNVFSLYIFAYVKGTVNYRDYKHI